MKRNKKMFVLFEEICKTIDVFCIVFFSAEIERSSDVRDVPI